MTTLGVNPSGDTAWLALMDEQEGVAVTPDRFRLPKRPRPEALLTALEDVEMMYHEHDISTVAVLDAHGNASPRSYQSVRPRFTLELIFEVAAARTDVSLELLSPNTVQSRLDLPTRSLPDHIDDAVAPSGTRWNHRGPAALAAAAAARAGP